VPDGGLVGKTLLPGADDGWTRLPYDHPMTEHADRPLVTVLLAVVGAHLRGQPLHHQLTDRRAEFVTAASTAPNYRLYALATDPPKPGLVRVAPDDPTGAAIEVEVWSLGETEFGSFVAAIPSPLGIGKVTLADGSEVSGFIVEPVATEGSTEITRYGGWRAYLAQGATDGEHMGG